nr:hypothetical protein Iba_chr01bCG4400 [Ipomoea batatas]
MMLLRSLIRSCGKEDTPLVHRAVTERKGDFLSFTAELLSVAAKKQTREAGLLRGELGTSQHLRLYEACTPLPASTLTRFIILVQLLSIFPRPPEKGRRRIAAHICRYALLAGGLRGQRGRPFAVVRDAAAARRKRIGDRATATHPSRLRARQLVVVEISHRYISRRRRCITTESFRSSRTRSSPDDHERLAVATPRRVTAVEKEMVTAGGRTVGSERMKIFGTRSLEFRDIDACCEEVKKIEKVMLRSPERKDQKTKANGTKMFGEQGKADPVMDSKNGNYMGYPSYSSYSTESDTASDGGLRNGPFRFREKDDHESKSTSGGTHKTGKRKEIHERG